MSRDLTPIKYENWKLVKFSDVCKIVNGQVDPKVEPYSSMIHIGNANIEKFTGRLLECKSAKEDNQTSGKYLFDERHVLYGKINPQFAKVTFPQFRGVCSADVYPIETNDKLLPLYLKYILLSDNFTKYSISLSGRTGIPKVNREDMYAYKFLLPPLKEQQKIAEILSSVDAAIEKTEQVIAKTEEVKKGLMQQLLTKGIGHTEFKQTEIGEIPVEWEIINLENLVEILDGKRKPIKKADRVLGSYPYYGATGIIDWVNDYIFDDDLILVGEDGENLKSRLLPMAFKISGKTWVNNHAHVLKTTTKINIDFLVNWLEFIDYTDYITGTAQPKLNQQQLKRIKVVRPNLDEQIKIAAIINDVDMKLSSERKYIDNLINLKQGLMQQLLTGQVRVKID